MKRIILAALGSALLLPSQAQQKNKEYTNFNDSVFSINEVVVATNYRQQDRCFETGCSWQSHSYFNQLHYFRNA